jgi:hypothetical protein
MMMMMASFFLRFRSGSRRVPFKYDEMEKAFRSFSGGFLAAFQKIFFFPPFRSFQKKIFKACPLGGDCTVISDGHARRRRSEKKTSLFYIIHTQILSRVVLNTQKKST